MRCACRRSRSGSCASSASSSGSSSRWRPASRSWSIATSSALARSSSSRRISGSGERLVGDVRQRGPAPQIQRLARGALGEQPLEAARRPPGRGRAAAGRRARACRSHRFAVRGHRLAQLRDVELHHLRRRRRRLVAPQPVDQALGGDRRAGVEREHREQGPRLRSAEGDRSVDRALTSTGPSNVICICVLACPRGRSYVGPGSGSTALTSTSDGCGRATVRRICCALARSAAARSASPACSATPASSSSTPATS